MQSKYYSPFREKKALCECAGIQIISPIDSSLSNILQSNIIGSRVPKAGGENNDGQWTLRYIYFSTYITTHIESNKECVM